MRLHRFSHPHFVSSVRLSPAASVPLPLEGSCPALSSRFFDTRADVRARHRGAEAQQPHSALRARVHALNRARAHQGAPDLAAARRSV
eukprot:6189865-Pleurochrysis_carterae.AAC.3